MQPELAGHVLAMPFYCPGLMIIIIIIIIIIRGSVQGKILIGKGQAYRESGMAARIESCGRIHVTFIYHH